MNWNVLTTGSSLNYLDNTETFLDEKMDNPGFINTVVPWDTSDLACEHFEIQQKLFGKIFFDIQRKSEIFCEIPNKFQ